MIGVPHPKWEERPLLVVVPAAGARPVDRHHLESKIAKWWMPDDVVFVEALSYGAAGKIKKMELPAASRALTAAPRPRLP